jgi:hypothetical protein
MESSHVSFHFFNAIDLQIHRKDSNILVIGAEISEPYVPKKPIYYIYIYNYNI